MTLRLRDQSGVVVGLPGRRGPVTIWKVYDEGPPKLWKQWVEETTSWVGDPVDFGLYEQEIIGRIAVVAARSPDSLISGAITRDSNGAPLSAPVTWPDGTPGTYVSDVVSTIFPGAVDAYHITYGSPVTKTYTQPAITRDSAGVVTNVPAILES